MFNRLIQQIVADVLHETMETSFEPLGAAVAEGDVETLSLLLAQGADPNLWETPDRNLLQLAATHRCAAAVDILLKHGARIHPGTVQSDGRNAPLMIACRNDDVATARVFLDSSGDFVGWLDALYESAANGSAGCLNYMREASQKSNFAASRAQEALRTAAQAGNLVSVNALLRTGVDKNTTDGFGRTALIYASGSGHLDCVRALLAEGADTRTSSLRDDYCSDIKRRAYEYGGTAVFVAAAGGHVACLRALLEGGACPNTFDDIEYNGATALHLAVRAGSLPVVTALIDFGANVNSKDNDKKTPLHWAARAGNFACALALLEAGGDANSKATALGIATEAGHDALQALLLSHGVQPRTPTPSAEPPLLFLAVALSGRCLARRSDEAVAAVEKMFAAALEAYAAATAAGRLADVHTQLSAFRDKHQLRVIEASMWSEEGSAAFVQAAAAVADAAGVPPPFAGEFFETTPAAPRASAMVLRIVRIRAGLRLAQVAEADAAARTVSVLQELSAAIRSEPAASPSSSPCDAAAAAAAAGEVSTATPLDKLRYAAAVSVRRWSDLRVFLAKARAKKNPTEARLVAARAAITRTLERLRGQLEATGGGAAPGIQEAAEALLAFGYDCPADEDEEEWFWEIEDSEDFSDDPDGSWEEDGEFDDEYYDDEYESGSEYGGSEDGVFLSF